MNGTQFLLLYSVLLNFALLAATGWAIGRYHERNRREEGR